MKARNNPFNECDEVEFKIRFRLSKSTVQKLLEQFSVRTSSLTHYEETSNPVKIIINYTNNIITEHALIMAAAHKLA